MHVAGNPRNNLWRATSGRPAGPAELLFLLTLAGLLVAGVLFRSWGVVTGTLDFWADEAWWAVIVAEEPLLEPSIRPMAYMWLSALLSNWGPPEVMLRLPSYLGGIGVLACVCASAFLLFKTRAAVLFVVFLAVLHPKLIVYAKEFKPYSFEVFIHSSLLLWALVCWQRRRSSVAFWIASFMALPFCYNIVFLYPGLLLALAPRALEWTGMPALGRYAARNLDRRLLGALVVVVVVACLATSGLFDNPRKIFWGEKYGVFPVGLSIVESLFWYARETWQLVTQPGGLRAVDPTSQGFIRSMLFVAYLLGIANLVRTRRLALLALLASPLACMAAANVVGFWPYGDFRTNLFMIPYVLLVTGLGLDALATHPRVRMVTWAAMLSLVFVLSPRDFDHFRWKWMRDGAPSPQLTEVLDDVLARRQLDGPAVRNVIVADWHSWRVIDYYLRYHPEASRTHTETRDSTKLVRGPLNAMPVLEDLLQEEYRQAVENREPTRVWVIVTKLDQFRGLGATPLVRQFGVYTNEFATQDPVYHPQLIELRFEWTPLGGGVDAGG